MALTLKILDNANEKAWDDLVFSSPQGTIFHTIAWLKLAKEQSNAEFVPLMFYRGTQIVAIFPLFIQKQGMIRVALSPPSKSYMLYLGPIIANYESLKQDKKETTYIEIQNELDNYIFKIKGCKFARIRTSPGLYDSRPLIWSGYTVDPNYTYRIDLTQGIDHVWENFEHKLRVKINKTLKEGVTVRSGDKEDLEFIHDSLFKRYQEQGLNSQNYYKYLLAIYNQFYPENFKIFIAEYKEQRVGGAIYLCFKNIMYSWVGKPKTDLVGISPNDLIHWEAIKWAQTNGLEYYEIMDGGDNPRLRHFKAKYNPDLVIWYSATNYSSIVYKIGEKLFNLIKK
jgi:lipid II:glycine glycyltransferase (peptidoglycan interpeptide bridge formation enzyme)